MQLIDIFPFIPLLFGLLTIAVPRVNQWVRIVPILGTLVTLGMSVGFAAGYFALGSTATTDSVHAWIGGPWVAAHRRVERLLRAVDGVRGRAGGVGGVDVCGRRAAARLHVLAARL